MSKPPAKGSRIWRIIRRAALAPVIFFLLGIFLSSCRTSLSPLPPKEERSYGKLLDWALDNGMPGAILLVQSPQESFLQSVGFADLRKDIPMRTNHAFQVGSVTKMFMGVTCARLHAEGILNMDQSITNWLEPSLTRRLPNAESITLRHLLQHTSGIPDFASRLSRNLNRTLLDRKGDWGPMEELNYVLNQPAEFPPGEGWAYSNSGYILAGLILDKVTGRHHSQAIREQVLDPLQMTQTWYQIQENARTDLAHGYEDWFYWWWTDTSTWTPPTGGSAGLASTVTDLASFIRSVARSENGFLNEDTRREIFEQELDEDTWYFLGLHRSRTRKETPWFLGHSGGTPGYHCFAFHQPEADVTIVFFGSSSLYTIGGRTRMDDFYMILRNTLFRQSLKKAGHGKE